MYSSSYYSVNFRKSHFKSLDYCTCKFAFFRSQHNGPRTKQLNIVNITIADQGYCRSMYKKRMIYNTAHICANERTVEKGSCKVSYLQSVAVHRRIISTGLHVQFYAVCPDTSCYYLAASFVSRKASPRSHDFYNTTSQCNAYFELIQRAPNIFLDNNVPE